MYFSMNRFLFQHMNGIINYTRHYQDTITDASSVIIS